MTKTERALLKAVREIIDDDDLKATARVRKIRELLTQHSDSVAEGTQPA